MQKFRDKRMMGHAFQRCGFKIKVKWKGIGKKKRQFSGLLFFYRSLKLVHQQLRLLGQDDLSVAYLYLNIY